MFPYPTARLVKKNGVSGEAAGKTVTGKPSKELKITFKFKIKGEHT